MKNPVYDENRVAIWQGDVRTVLAQLSAGIVQCCVTRPPYWGLRDYNTGTWDGGDVDCDHVAKDRGKYSSGNIEGGSTLHSARAGYEPQDNTKRQFIDVCGKCGGKRIDLQIGLEATSDEFIGTMVAVFREVRRVLRDDGTLWLNMGDSYAGSGGQSPQKGDLFKGRLRQRENICLSLRGQGEGLKPKDMVGMPWMLALALRADGWYLRSDIIWSKPNPMPESVTDRPTKAHEYIFLLTKSERYFYDADAIRERVTGNAHSRGDGVNPKATKPGNGIKQNQSFAAAVNDLVAERNKRSVWEVATQAFPEAHFATFPEELIQPCILAGTSEKGCCALCGAPWRRIVDILRSNESGSGKALENRTPSGWHQSGSERWRPEHVEYFGPKGKMAGGTQVRDDHDIRLGPTTSSRTIGWEPSCSCPCPDPTGREIVPCIILDPFFGSGTTALVGRKNGCRTIGVELNPEYIAIARRRLSQSILPF